MPLQARKSVCFLLAAVSFLGSTSEGAPGNEVHCAAHGPGPITTSATVTATGTNGALTLHPQERVALQFLTSIETLEFWCVQEAQRACTLNELTASDTLAEGFQVGCLKYDPSDDHNYNYSLTVNGKSWEARANSKKRDLLGFHFKSTQTPHVSLTFYIPRGTSGSTEKELEAYGVTGESFVLP